MISLRIVSRVAVLTTAAFVCNTDWAGMLRSTCWTISLKRFDLVSSLFSLKIRSKIPDLMDGGDLW